MSNASGTRTLALCLLASPLSLLLLLMTIPSISHAQSPAPLLLRNPTVSRTRVVFAYAGRLWSVDRRGGTAERLTTGTAEEDNPCFSPDGRQIAFTASYSGNRDVYVIPSAGGTSTQLTYHPGDDYAMGWSPDGKRVLYRSNSNRGTSGSHRLFTVPVEGGPSDALPLPIAEQGSYSPNGKRLAYVPMSQWQPAWKRYRGGQTLPIWLVDLADLRIENIPRDNSNDFNPMWVGNQVYFLSDRNGATTLFAYNTQTHRASQVIENKGFDLKSASVGADAIVYEQFGSLHLFDLATQKEHPLTIYLPNDLPETRPRTVNVGNRITTASVSPTGEGAVCEARGEIFTVSGATGEVRNLTNSPGVMERAPAWSPDGKWIAYFTDASGEYQLHLQHPDGAGEIKTFRLGEHSGFYFAPVWSPDSQKIAFHDSHLRLWYLDLTRGMPVLIATNPKPFIPFFQFAPSWSPDSRWLAYSCQLKSFLSAVFVYSLETERSTPITDGTSDARSAIFDCNGRYLYFTASTDVGPALWAPDMSSINRPISRNIYAAVLQKDTASPLVSADSNTENAPAQVNIDFDGIRHRIVPLPLPARNYLELRAGKAGAFYLLSGDAILFPFGQPSLSVHRFDIDTRKEEAFLSGVTNVAVSANGEKLLYRQRQQWHIAATAQPPKQDEPALKMEAMEVRIEPRAEWKQMYRETWRYVRDTFYDCHFHGLDLQAMERKYAVFVDGISSRADLNYLFSEMLSELTSSHVDAGGGDMPATLIATETVGLLGADFTVENNRFRITRVYNGESWNPYLVAPLAQPGAIVNAGEYLLSVEDREITAAQDIYRYFVGTANKQIRLRVSPSPDGSGARTILVTPIEDETGLRRVAWAEDNRRRVSQLSNGRLAYISLPNTHLNGYASFNRDYFSQVDKEGIVLDARFNGGGFTADYIIDCLRRSPMGYYTPRYGDDISAPAAAITGPKAMLINELAGSGGDAIAWLFRAAKLGPLVGKRTWGGLMQVLNGLTLLDGGSVGVAQLGFYSPNGTWDVENQGISPDIEVELTPKAWRDGHDPQLEKAVVVVLDALKKNPTRKPKRPAAPNYHPVGRHAP